MDSYKTLITTQFGLITRDQLSERFITRRAIEHRIAAGELEIVGKGIYRLVGTPETWSQRAQLAVLRGGGSGNVLSHGTAAHLYRLDGFREPPSVIELSTTHHVTPTDWLRVHRIKTAPAVCMRQRLPVTTLLRTLVDLGETLESDTAFDLAVDSARRLDRGFDDTFARFVERDPNLGRKGLVRLSAAMNVRRSRLDSPLEVRMARALAELRQAPPFVAGHSVFRDGHFLIKLDFAWPAHLVALHTDGTHTHTNRKQFQRDAYQRSLLSAMGWANVIVTEAAFASAWWKEALLELLATRGPQETLFTLPRPRLTMAPSAPIRRRGPAAPGQNTLEIWPLPNSVETPGPR